MTTVIVKIDILMRISLLGEWQILWLYEVFGVVYYSFGIFLTLDISDCFLALLHSFKIRS